MSRVAPRLFNLDTVMVDVVMRVVALPTRGGDSLANSHVVTTGGGFNVMSAAARQGMDVTYVGRLGRGAFSDLARADLASLAIDAPLSPAGGLDVGFCVVLVDESGERTFVTAPGAELTLSSTDLDTVAPHEGDYVFLSGYSLVYPEIGPAVAAWIAGLAPGVVVAFDPAPRVLDIDASILDPVLARTDWLLLNTVEAMALSGEEELGDVIEVLLTVSGRRGIVIHADERGCVLATREGDVHEVAGFAIEVLDTNGAGDTHDGVVLAELSRGSSVIEAATRANAAAALAVERVGPATCPDREEITSFLAGSPRRTN